jgi:hypothetical protein
VTKNYTGISLLFAPKILQVFPSADLSIPIFLGYGLHGNAATLSGGNQDAGNYSIAPRWTTCSATASADLQRLFSDATTQPGYRGVDGSKRRAVQGPRAARFHLQDQLLGDSHDKTTHARPRRSRSR